METRIYMVDGRKMLLSTKNLNIVFDAYCRTLGINKTMGYGVLADAMNLPMVTIRSWFSGNNIPSSIDILMDLTKELRRTDYRDFLVPLDGAGKKEQLTERQVIAVKKIYDSCIRFLNEFVTTNGFVDCLHDLEARGVEDSMDAAIKLADNKYNKVRLVSEQEYFDLKDTGIYKELYDFVNEDLVDIYEGKLDFAYMYETEPGNSAYEEYADALMKLNRIIDDHM